MMPNYGLKKEKKESRLDSPERILISGTNGFLGKNLLTYSEFFRKNHDPVGREDDSHIVDSLRPARTAIHLAGLAHQSFRSSDSEIYYKSNVLLSLDFLKKASEVGVKHFIYISTSKVFGEGQDEPYTEKSILNPQDVYSRSKLQAEEELSKLASQIGVRLSILRPPLLYGPNPKANFLTMLKFVKLGIPVPISSQSNRRSFLSTYNFSDFLLTLIQSKSLKSKIYLLQDPKPISTQDLVTAMAIALGKNPKFLKIPHRLGSIATSLIGKSLAWKKWTGSFYLDDADTRSYLKWQPNWTTMDSLLKTVLESK
jgi:nucleoside-diphosphate-sugar epimerase